MTGGGGRGVIAATSAPSPAHVGQRWFNTATAITYQYTRDAAGTKFWLDISSGGIGTSAGRGVDFVGDTDPHLETNGSGLAVGSVYYNRETDRYFYCTTATTNSNVWAGRYAGSGGVETTYKSGSDFFRVHTFLSSGTFFMEDATDVDYLVVGGGGGGANGGSNTGQGGGGGGGFRTAAALSTAVGTYAITVGAGGLAGTIGVNNDEGKDGGSSIFSSITSKGGGGGNGQSQQATTGLGSGGGGEGWTSGSSGEGTGNSGTAGQGNTGGNASGKVTGYGAGGGGGAGAVGGNGSTSAGGDGGVGEDEVMGLNASDSYALLTNANAGAIVSGARYFSGGGGGGIAGTQITISAGGSGGGGNGAQAYRIIDATDGSPNTGGGGGGGSYHTTNAKGGRGGSGIVILRYQINA